MLRLRLEKKDGLRTEVYKNVKNPVPLNENNV